MKLNRFVYIFVALIALSLVGCGSSSNPASSGNVSNGLVNVSGNVKNLNGSGSVSFYTPTAAARSNLNVATSFRASVVNDGVYTFNTDEKGNYSGQIPEGDYYVIAQNSDGTMKSVSAMQTFSSPRAATQNFTLTETIDIQGTLNFTDSAGEVRIPVSGVPVCIEGKPFISVTDSSGSFVFNAVPTLKGTETYNIKATFCTDGTLLTQEKELTSSNITQNHELILPSPKSAYYDNKKAINGCVYDNSNDKNLQPNKLVIAILGSSGQAISTISGSDGKFSLIVDKNETSVQITANVKTFYTAQFSNINLVEPTYNNEIYTFENQTGGEIPTPEALNGIYITEKTDSNFKPSNESTIALFYSDNNGMHEYLSESFYYPATYTICNLPVTSYWYMLESKDYANNTYGYRICELVEVEADTFVTASNTYSIVIAQPTITISEDSYELHSIITHEPSTDERNIAKPFAYAVREGDPNSHITLDVDDDNIINFEVPAFVTEPIGVYEIHAGYTIEYNGVTINSVYADPVPYVKHNEPN